MSAYTILTSIIEGLTEFLPVSSTAHLIIASKLMSVDLADTYIKFYILFIQLGALCAGIFIFARRLFSDKKLFVNICISFVPTAILGFALYKMFKHLLEGNMMLIAGALFVGGVVFIYLEKVFMKQRGGGTDPGDFGKTDISYTDASIIGLAQTVAIIPGVSRSGATIVAGIFRGIKKSVIIEYTFILALPTLGAAVVYDMYKSRDMLASLGSFDGLISGFIISFIVAGIVLYILKKYLARISLTAFGWYRIILAVVIVMYFI